MGAIKKSDLAKVRIPQESGKVIQVEKEDGVLLFTVVETKQALKDLVEEYFFDSLLEVEKQSNETLAKKVKIIDKKLDLFEERMVHFIDARIDKISQSISDMLISRVFEAEVERKVTERLNKRGKM